MKSRPDDRAQSFGGSGMNLILTVVITSVVAYVVIGWAGPMAGEYNSTEGYEAQTSWCEERGGEVRWLDTDANHGALFPQDGGWCDFGNGTMKEIPAASKLRGGERR